MRLHFLLPAFLCAATPVVAQHPALQQGPKPAPPPTSSFTAQQLLDYAVSHTGLAEVPGEPWHVKATFDVLTSPAMKKYTTGSYEETWYAPKNYTRTWSYKGRTHTDYATPDGLYRLGDQAWPEGAELHVRKLLTNPLPTDPVPAGITLRVQDLAFGKTAIPCVFEVGAIPAGLDKDQQQAFVENSPHLCFEPSMPILRYSTGVDATLPEVTYSRVTEHHGRIVAEEYEVLDHRAVVLRIHVSELNDVPPLTGAVPAPPAGAVKLAGPQTVPWDALERLPSPTNRAIVPLGAKLQGSEDTVVVQAVIAPDGTVSFAKVMSGELSLRPNALLSVQESKFKPFTILGTPVEVHTEAHIRMNPGGAEGQGGRDEGGGLQP